MRHRKREDHLEDERQRALRYIKSVSNERYYHIKPITLSKIGAPDPLEEDPNFYPKFTNKFRAALVGIGIFLICAVLLRLSLM